MIPVFGFDAKTTAVSEGATGRDRMERGEEGGLMGLPASPFPFAQLLDSAAAGPRDAAAPGFVDAASADPAATAETSSAVLGQGPGRQGLGVDAVAAQTPTSIGGKLAGGNATASAGTVPEPAAPGTASTNSAAAPAVAAAPGDHVDARNGSIEMNAGAVETYRPRMPVGAPAATVADVAAGIPAETAPKVAGGESLAGAITEGETLEGEPGAAPARASGSSGGAFALTGSWWTLGAHNAAAVSGGSGAAGVAGVDTGDASGEGSKSAASVRSQVAAGVAGSRAFAEGKGDLRLQLNPQDLGRLDVVFQREGDHLLVTITAETDAAAKALREGAGELGDILAARGGNWRSAQVVVANEKGEETGERESDARSDGDPQRDRGDGETGRDPERNREQGE